MMQKTQRTNVDTMQNKSNRLPSDITTARILNNDKQLHCKDLKSNEVTKAHQDGHQKLHAAEAQGIHSHQSGVNGEMSSSDVWEHTTTFRSPVVVKIRDTIKCRKFRVKIFGWVHQLVRDSNKSVTLTLRDGTGFLPCVLNTKQGQESPNLTKECSIAVCGEIKEMDDKNRSEFDRALVVDFLEVIGSSPLEGIDKVVSNGLSTPETHLDQRHLLVREAKLSKILKMKSAVMQCFREHFLARGCTEFVPPTVVKYVSEMGAPLFSVNYFGEFARLTPSSQLYLESVLPSLGDVYCIAPSFRAESCKSRRHLAEYTHVEAEFAFISYEDLLNKIEDIICDVVDRILQSPYGQVIYDFNPNFSPPKKPFKRMKYSDALKWLEANNVTKDDGTFYRFGDDIPEAPERKMVDAFNEPILLCNFPVEMKAFYMKRLDEDRRVTETVDLLMPNVGEVLGASMRIWDLEELKASFEEEKLDPDDFYWYTDLRKYGSCPHGGFGLGLERFLSWLLNCNHITEVCGYPRFIGRCVP